MVALDATEKVTDAITEPATSEVEDTTNIESTTGVEETTKKGKQESWFIS